jgi:hypothetical protein
MARSRMMCSKGTIVLALALLVAACKKFEPSPAASAPVVAAPAGLTPDAPKAFGPRCVWLAFRTTSAAVVMRALALNDVAPSTWVDGVKAAYAGRIFVTPPMGEWVLAASTRFPDPGDGNHPDLATPALTRLSQVVGEVQYFGTDEDVGWHAWARFVHGAPVRKLAYLAAHDLVIWADGEPSPEERKLGLVYTRKGLREPPFPSEKDLFAIAGAWSVDPSALETRHLPPSLGLVGSGAL